MFRFYVLSLVMLLPLSSHASDAALDDLINNVQRLSGFPSPGLNALRGGAVAFREGRFSEARNAWVQAEAWLERTPSATSSEKSSMRELLARAERLAAPPPVEAAATPEASPEPARTPRKRARVRTPQVPDGNAILLKARAAREAGEVEKAIKLYRIAAQLPGGEAGAAEADALERTMR